MAKEFRHGLKEQAPSASEKQDVFQTPPPATAMPGMSGNPPMPPGRMVATDNLTDEELTTLKTIPGWRVGDPVPDNLAEILEQVRQQHMDDMRPDRLRPPVSPDTPPLQVPEPVDLSKLPPEEQASFRATLDQSQQMVRDAEEAQKRQVPGAGPGINEHWQGDPEEIELEDDTEAATYAGTNIPKSSPPPAAGSQKAAQEPQNDPEPDRTGASTQLRHDCPRCGHDQRMPDIPDPDYADKQRYLLAMVGTQPFQKAYELFDGQMTIVLRELAPYEVDLCFKQSNIDRRAGQFDTADDFFETLQRYRICLQLVRITSQEVQHTFPASIQEWTGQGDVETTKGTILPAIYKQIYQDVIKTESFNRVLGIEVSRFNRLLAKMEANAENENFWRETEQQA